MALTVRQALELEAAVHASSVLEDIDALLRAMRTTLWLRWQGKWAELGIRFPGDADLRVVLRVCRKWAVARPVLDDPLAADFWDRFRKVLDLHGADVGLGLCEGGVAKCQIVLPRAPKERPTDHDFAVRLLITTKGKLDSREVEGVNA